MDAIFSELMSCPTSFFFLAPVPVLSEGNVKEARLQKASSSSVVRAGVGAFWGLWAGCDPPLCLTKSPRKEYNLRIAIVVKSTFTPDRIFLLAFPKSPHGGPPNLDLKS